MSGSTQPRAPRDRGTFSVAPSIFDAGGRWTCRAGRAFWRTFPSSSQPAMIPDFDAGATGMALANPVTRITRMAASHDDLPA